MSDPTPSRPLSTEDSAAPRSVSRLIAAHAERRPDVVVLADESGRGLTWAELEASVRGTAAALRDLDIAREDVVALAAPTGIAAAALICGVVSSAVAAPQHVSLTVHEARSALISVGATAVVATDADAPTAVAARRLGIRVVAASELGRAAATRESARELEHAAQGDRALLLPTTGTTGKAKLVPLTHGNLIAGASATAVTLQLDEDDVCVNVMPLFHTHGLVGALLSSLWAGGTVVCLDRLADAPVLAAAERWSPTWTTAAPALHRVILNTARRAPSAFTFRLVRSASAPLPLDLLDELESVYRAPLVEAYALTEAPGQVTSNPLPPATRKRGTVGVATGCEVRVLADGEAAGEIAVCGPQVMAGYVGDGDVRASDGWLHTGDLGGLDKDGYLTITGRIKEVVNRGGEKVLPTEVDAALAQFPGVADAVSFPVAHRTLGEDLWAAVTVEGDATIDAAEVLAFVRGRIAAYKVPTRILVVDTIPRTPTGKIRRSDLSAALGIVRGPRRGR